MFVGLISDTHGAFPQDVKDFLAPVDCIWHAGDFGTLDCALEIAAFKPLTAVYGNADGQELRLDYPEYRCFDCEGLKVLMIHIGLKKGSYWAYDPGRPIYDTKARNLIEHFRPDVFVCGHTHIPQVFVDKKYEMLFMNPGACGHNGPREVPRMALRFRIEKGKVSGLEKCKFF